ncbi:MAG TPA: SDR family NAD(P)-dependent oxidoreductase [Candidatus Sulfomarinibacteraceae bacterium]|nr:SDR family NAD(P)-dependent oxidoreductase [Candidatus Sulfomarinibacteraceae bacterium]
MAVDLAGRTVLVTGASSGIGEAVAEAFAGAGCRLLLTARRRDRLEALADRLRINGAADVAVGALDVRDRAAVAAFVDGLDEAWSVVDILVNNAGLARGLAPLHEGDVTDWEEMLDTNVKGLLWVTRAVLPGMVERGNGHVINIGSIAGHETYPSGNVYCATKHAVTALNRCLAIDLLGTGVRVSSVDPGLVETEFSMVRFHGDRERADAVYRGLEPLVGRDVADAVLFCATRPPRANVREMILLPTAQAAAVHVHRSA